MEVVQLAAEMILFYIPDAPKEVLMAAMSVLTMGNLRFGGF